MEEDGAAVGQTVQVRSLRWASMGPTKGSAIQEEAEGDRQSDVGDGGAAVAAAAAGSGGEKKAKTGAGGRRGKRRRDAEADDKAHLGPIRFLFEQYGEESEAMEHTHTRKYVEAGQPVFRKA